ncbi:MAG: SRPBCC domain-containing protein [Ardenticatenaceae bacterium]|nr:SRPBCC domain-containing protein [Ardenticatenaceae bacterium]
MSDEILTFDTKIEASKEQVYRALTDQFALPQWLCNDARTNASEGGRIYLYWQTGYEMTGRFTQLVENECVEFSWLGQDEPAPSTVEVTLKGSNGHTLVKLAHQGVGSGPEWSKTREQIQEGWESSLANLKMMLEIGVDKRVFDQAFMGIVPGGLLNDKEKAQLNVAGGLSLAQILEGSSMAKAGFKAGDVLIKVEETEIKSFSDLGSVLGSKKVGDQISVTYARDGSLNEAMVTLGTRPVPDVPADPAAFADQVAALYAELDAELDQIFAGVSNKAAFASPAEGEWSAAQVLGHLIVVERGVQMGVYMQLSGQAFNGFPANNTEIIDSITAVYPDIHDLLAAWKRTEAETVALIRGFPESFLARKIDYLNLGMTLLVGLPTHTRSHIPQIKEALAS